MKIDNWHIKHNDSEKQKRKEFGQRFQAFRQEKGLSIRKTALLMGVSEEMVMKIEQGEISPDFPNLKKRMERMSFGKKLIIA